MYHPPDRDKGNPCNRSRLAAGAKTVSRKQPLETGAQIPIGGPHSVNGDGYRTLRMTRNGALFATTRNSERETRLAGWGTRTPTQEGARAINSGSY
jgi:hypothetical protein